MKNYDLEKLKQDIVFEANLSGFDLAFHSTWGLFSPREIDKGTSLLIKNLEVKPDSKALDLGCGYGAIGLTMAKLAPEGIVHMLDRDFVAVKYARKNAELNNLPNCKAYLSNGFDDVTPKDFDMIASNLPAKVGKEMYSIMFHDARTHLKNGRKFYVVTIAGLKDYIKRSFMEIFGNYEKLAQNRGYVVAVAEKKD